MNNKSLLFLGASALVLLVALSVPPLWLRRNPARNLLLVSPMEDGSIVFDPQKLSQIAGDEFLLTYEVRRQTQVKTAYAQYPVTLVGTNSLYPALTLYPMLQGGFFTGAAEKEKKREAVLNRAAAFRLFGGEAVAGRTLMIEGAPWLVTGVMADGEEDSSRVYIPAAATGEGPRSLLVLLGRDVDAARVKNTLMSLGVNETSHVFFDLAGAVRLYGERFTLALQVFICALFWVFARSRAVVLKVRVSAVQARLKHVYTGELLRYLLREHTGKLLRFAFTVLGLMGGAAFCFALLAQVPALCLKWKEMPSLTAILGKGDFPALSAPLLDGYYPDTLAFALCLGVSGFIVFCVKPPPGSGIPPKPPL